MAEVYQHEYSRRCSGGKIPKVSSNLNFRRHVRKRPIASIFHLLFKCTYTPFLTSLCRLRSNITLWIEIEHKSRCHQYHCFADLRELRITKPPQGHVLAKQTLRL